MHKEVVISYPAGFMQTLESYIGAREGFVFVTRNDKQVHYRHIHRSFVQAGEDAGLPLRITPHVLRASVVTYLKLQGFNDTDIMKITGHASAEMVAAYDKTAQEDNISDEINLI